jgi:hypothetical protein
MAHISSLLSRSFHHLDPFLTASRSSLGEMHYLTDICFETCLNGETHARRNSCQANLNDKASFLDDWDASGMYDCHVAHVTCTKFGGLMASQALLNALLSWPVELFSFYLSRYVRAAVIGAQFILKTMTMPFISY